jgi:hypothetical protein
MRRRNGSGVPFVSNIIINGVEFCRSSKEGSGFKWSEKREGLANGPVFFHFNIPTPLEKW